MLRCDQLDVDRACALVIDLQEKLLPLIPRHERLLATGAKLLDGVRNPVQFFELPEADHRLHGHEREVAEQVVSFMLSTL